MRSYWGARRAKIGAKIEVNMGAKMRVRIGIRIRVKFVINETSETILGTCDGESSERRRGRRRGRR